MRSTILATALSCIYLITMTAQISGSFESGSAIAIYGKSESNYGIWGESINLSGVKGVSIDSIGIEGYSYFGKGISGRSWFQPVINGQSALASGGYFICLGKTEPDLVIGGTGNNNPGDDCVISSDPAYLGSDLFLRSYDAVVIELDKDQNENGQFEIWKGSGTVLVGINEAGSPITTSRGAYLSSSGVWTNAPAAASSARSKEQAPNPSSILAAIERLPIHSWSSKGEKHSRYLAPASEDFYAAFGLVKKTSTWQHLI